MTKGRSTMRGRWLLSIGAFAVAAFAANRADAQSWPNYTCGSGSTCPNVINSAAGTALLAQGPIGIEGESSAASGVGVYGTTSSGSGQGVLGVATNYTTGTGVQGESYSGAGVYGSSTTDYGVRGTSAGGAGYAGVYGINTAGSGVGVLGRMTPSGTGAAVYGDNGGSGTGWAGYFYGNVTITGALTVGSCTGCSSDQRLKQNIEPLTGAVDQLLRLKAVTFDWKNPEEHQDQPGRQTGFIAQDVEKIFPKWVGEDKKGFKTLVIPEKQMAALTVESIRTLKAQNDALQTQSLNFQERIKALEAGRRPMISGFGEGGIGFGLLAVAGALMTRRKHSDRQAM